MSDVLVEFNNISKFFGSVIALKDVTMKVKKGEIMCLLGDNGAGKSTLIKTLSGVHKPDENGVEGKNRIRFSRDAEYGYCNSLSRFSSGIFNECCRNFFMEENLKVLDLLKLLIFKRQIKLQQKGWVK